MEECMMKKVIMIILGIIIAGCFIAFYTTTKSFLINNSTEKSDIAVTNGAFDITPESGVEIFNKDCWIVPDSERIQKLHPKCPSTKW